MLAASLPRQEDMTATDDIFIPGREEEPGTDFATAVDIMLSDSRLFIYDRSHTVNAAKVQYILEQLGYSQKIAYHPLPVISDPYGHTDIIGLLEKGFLPDAIINYLLSLSLKSPVEIFTLPEAIGWFSPDNLYSEKILFDINALRKLNRSHLELMDDKKLSSLYGFADMDIGKVIRSHLDIAPTLKELDQFIRPILSPKPCAGKIADQMRETAEIISRAPALATYEELIEYIQQHSSIRGMELVRILDLLIAGTVDGIGAQRIYPHIKSYILEVARCQPS
jgi:glutamyl-tRNA synthetase